MKKVKDAPKPETVLILRTCDSEMRSHNGQFTWPVSGSVECSDWSSVAACGNGLHGWLWGAGDWSLRADGENIKWLVVEVDKSTVVDLQGKVKFPRGDVVGCFGNWRDAMAMIRKRVFRDTPIGMVTSATAGDSSHSATAGDSSHSATAGDSSHSATAGDYSHSATAGHSSHSATAGDYSHSATAGRNSVAAAIGFRCKVKAGIGGALITLWQDPNVVDKKIHVKVAYVGEDGIKADTWYRVNDAGKFVECDE